MVGHFKFHSQHNNCSKRIMRATLNNLLNILLNPKAVSHLSPLIV